MGALVAGGDVMIGDVLNGILIADIQVADGTRAFQPNKVTDIAKFTERMGLLSSISGRLIGDGPQLVYGSHRDAAARLLGWHEIECHALQADERLARMAGIAENWQVTALRQSGCLRSKEYRSISDSLT